MAAKHSAISGEGPSGLSPESPLPTVPSAASAVVSDAADGARVLQLCHEATRAAYEHALIDRAALSGSHLVAQIEATQSLINAAMAVQLVRIAQYAATVQHIDPATEEVREVAHELGYTAEFADVDLAAALSWGPRQATARVEEAIDAVTKVPRLVDRMASGDLDAARVTRVTRELIEAPESVCAEVEDALICGGIEGWSSRQAQARTRRLVQRIDPAAARTSRTRRSVDRIGVFLQPGAEVGLTEWTAVLPTEQAAEAYAAVDTLARELRAATTAGKTLGQCRVDAMCDLIGQQAQVSATMTFSVPVRTPADRADAPSPARDDAHDHDDAYDRDDAHDGEVLDGEVLEGADWDAALAEMVARDPGRPPDPPPGDPWWDELDDAVRRSHESEQATRAAEHDDHCTDHGEAARYSTDRAARGGGAAVRVADPVRAGGPAARLADAASGAARACVIGDVDVAGVGVIPAEAVSRLMRDLDIAVVRVLVEESTGTLLETSTRSYRPTAAMRRFVQERDGHCRFPGCSHPARWCEIDHVVAWPIGATRPDDLQLLCKHHHRAKHETAWTVAMTPDGVCTWTSPHGRAHVTRPHRTAG